MRFTQARCDTFRWHLNAKWALLTRLGRRATGVADEVAMWNYVPVKPLKAPKWSPDQEVVLAEITKRLKPDEGGDEKTKPLYLGGDPGTGKSEIMVHAAHQAADSGMKVLLMCPTGTLVHAYRERLPAHVNITVETIHSATVMVRDQDQVVMYAPPSRLRQYELFLIDEGSQIDDPVAIRLRMALSELPHRHVLMVAADYRQLQPIEGGGHMLHWCMEMEQHYLKTVHRTDDPRLLLFLITIRKEQPTREFLRSFWENFVLPPDLELAVRISRHLQKTRGHHFMWLCVTNSGANKINDMALKVEGVTDEQRQYGYDGDENAKAGKMFIRPGLMIRLTRNLDKTRGFVNGALAEVHDVLSETPGKGVAVFSAKLTTGAMVLVHPIRVEGKVFLPCCYGYATTIRRSQGSSLWLGALWFDHCYPPERGYGYVGASRFRNRDGLFHYGKVRRTDWIPVGKVQDDWELRRSGDSVSSSSGRGSENEDDGFD